MKLLTRTAIYFTIIAFLVFAVGGLVFYHELRSTTHSDADERLGHEKDEVASYMQNHQALPPISLSLGDSIAYRQTAGLIKERLVDTILFTKSEQEYEPYRKLEFGTCKSSQYYCITIFKPLIESDDLTDAILQTIAIIGAILLVALVLSNILIAKSAWKPFYNSLDKIKIFDINNKNPVVFDYTSVKEFRALNDVLKGMTGKISSDYNSLKEFTENASHELQTPLSIIQSKLELLIQSEDLSAKQMEEIQVVYESTARLSKLNQALLLLAKIENRQFTEIKQIQLNALIEQKIDFFEELIKHKDILVEKQIHSLSLTIHPALADILVSNLVGNAIKHNVQGGSLRIQLNNSKLTISNSGNLSSVSPAELFQRFRKADSSSDSLGLGLAIVKEICNMYGFDIQYKYEGSFHSISVCFFKYRNSTES